MPTHVYHPTTHCSSTGRQEPVRQLVHSARPNKHGGHGGPRRAVSKSYAYVPLETAKRPGMRPPCSTHTAPTSAALEWMRCGGGVPTVLHCSQRSCCVGQRRCIAHICRQPSPVNHALSFIMKTYIIHSHKEDLHALSLGLQTVSTAEARPRFPIMWPHSWELALQKAQPRL